MKPIYIMFQDGLSTDVTTIACQGIAEMLTLANVVGKVKVKNFGVWRSPNWRTGNTLNAYESVDWYCNNALDKSRNQLHCSKLAMSLITEPWQKLEPHYDVVILKDDLYDDDTSFVFGYSWGGQAVSSFCRFQKYVTDKRMQLEVFKTIVMHEVGHMLGLVNENRNDIVYSLGWHCTHGKCLMRQGLELNAWIQYTHDRLQSSSPLCSHCQEDLRNYVSWQSSKAAVS